MENKISIFIAIFLLILSIAYANVATISEEGNKYEVSYEGFVQPGWNLLPSDTFALWEIGEESESAIEKATEVFIYLPSNKEFISTKNGINSEDNTKAQENNDYLRISASWYYFKESTPIKFTFPKTKLENIKLYAGWNLISLPPQVGGKEPTLGWGNCEIEKVYIWFPGINKWENLYPTSDLNELTNEDAIGAGLAVKVKNICVLGNEAIQNTSQPLPVLPE